MAKLIIGCGYLGRLAAATWIDKGDEVFAVTRSAAKANDLEAEGIRPILADVNACQSLPQLPAASTVLHSLGFDRSAGQSIQEVYVDGLKNVLQRVNSGSLRRFLYISSTGVFGQNDGQWVDELSDCQPQGEGGRACLAAEQLLGEHPLGQRATILRLAGLYGPGRIPRRRELSAGLPIRVPTDGHLNLIHVADVMRVILAVERAASRPKVLLVSDGHPVRRAEYYGELARLLSAPDPRFETPDPGLPATRRAASNKRVNNQRMLDRLKVELLYPTYRDGLAAILQAEG